MEALGHQLLRCDHAPLPGSALPSHRRHVGSSVHNFATQFLTWCCSFTRVTSVCFLSQVVLHCGLICICLMTQGGGVSPRAYSLLAGSLPPCHVHISCSSFAQSCPILCDPMDSSTPPSPGVCTNSCPLSR